MFDKYGSNVIYSQQAFNYFYTKSPFIEYTGSHKNITIVAGTITWQSAKKEGTYFNTYLVFSSGKIIMSWDPRFEVYGKKFIVVICMDIGIYVRGNVINTDEQLIVVSSDLGISSYFAGNLTDRYIIENDLKKFASIIYCSESKPEAFTTMSSNPHVHVFRQADKPFLLFEMK